MAKATVIFPADPGHNIPVESHSFDVPERHPDPLGWIYDRMTTSTALPLQLQCRALRVNDIVIFDGKAFVNEATKWRQL